MTTPTPSPTTGTAEAKNATSPQIGSSASLGSVSDEYEERMSRRRAIGHAWVICNECGGKIADAAGHEDRDRPCPFKRAGRCAPR
jgi:hypothetical protein